MGKTFGNPFKTEKRDFYTGFIELILVGGITGIATGAVVTIFNVLMHEGEVISKGVYAYVRANPAFIPLLLLALLAGGAVNRRPRQPFLGHSRLRCTSSRRGVARND